MAKLDYFEGYYVTRDSLGVIHLRKDVGDPPSSKNYEYGERDIYEQHKRDFSHKIYLSIGDDERIEEDSKKEKLFSMMSTLTEEQIFSADQLKKVSGAIGKITKAQYKTL